MPLPSSTALVEFSTSHLVCLPAQISFLVRAGVQVHLVLHDGIRDRSRELQGAEKIHFLPVEEGLAGRWRAARALRRIILENKIDAVVFNTAEGNQVRDFSLIAPRGRIYAGILHHTNKLGTSFTQRIISRRINRYYVLMDYLMESLPETAGYRIRSFSPVFFPDPPAPVVPKPPGEFWVCIPGELEFRRRDYPGLLEALQNRAVHPAVRFIVLGAGAGQDGDGARFRSMLRATGKESQFVLFPDYVPDDVFASYLVQSDLILPLLHPGTPIYTHYRFQQISGAFLLAIGYSRPMLLDRSWESIEDFQPRSFFYGPGELIPVLNEIVERRWVVEEKREALRSSDKYSFASQQKRYLSLLT